MRFARSKYEQDYSRLFKIFFNEESAEGRCKIGHSPLRNLAYPQIKDYLTAISSTASENSLEKSPTASDKSSQISPIPLSLLFRLTHIKIIGLRPLENFDKFCSLNKTTSKLYYSYIRQREILVIGHRPLLNFVLLNKTTSKLYYVYKILRVNVCIFSDCNEKQS